MEKPNEFWVNVYAHGVGAQTYGTEEAARAACGANNGTVATVGIAVTLGSGSVLVAPIGQKPADSQANGPAEDCYGRGRDFTESYFQKIMNKRPPIGMTAAEVGAEMSRVRERFGPDRVGRDLAAQLHTRISARAAATTLNPNVELVGSDVALVMAALARMAGS